MRRAPLYLLLCRWWSPRKIKARLLVIYFAGHSALEASLAISAGEAPSDRRFSIRSSIFCQHGPLCLGQSAPWHVTSQYLASPHPPQTQSRGSERSYCFPQPQQTRRRRRGQYFKNGGPQLRLGLRDGELGLRIRLVLGRLRLYVVL